MVEWLLFELRTQVVDAEVDKIECDGLVPFGNLVDNVCSLSLCQPCDGVLAAKLDAFLLPSW